MVIEGEGDLDEAKGKDLRLVTPTSECRITRTRAASHLSYHISSTSFSLEDVLHKQVLIHHLMLKKFSSL
jgi:hypothetical protein